MPSLIKYAAIAVSTVPLMGLCGCAARTVVQADSVAGSAEQTEASPFIMTAAVFSGPGERGLPPGEFSFQFVLTDDTGGPPPGQVDLVAQVIDQNSGSVLSEQAFDDLEGDPAGRFNLCMTLPSASSMLEIASPAVRVIIEEKTEIVVPMKLAPRAWTAELARDAQRAHSANTAKTALFAEVAANANSADRLAGDTSVELVFEPGYDNYGFGYDPARATRVGDMIFVTGLIQNTDASGSHIATLPVNMRPPGRHIFHAHVSYLNPGQVRIDVLADGRVFILSPPVASLDWVPLSDIQFPVVD